MITVLLNSLCDTCLLCFLGLYAIEVAGALTEEDFQKCKDLNYTYKIPAGSKYSTI